MHGFLPNQDAVVLHGNDKLNITSEYECIKIIMIIMPVVDWSFTVSHLHVKTLELVEFNVLTVHYASVHDCTNLPL